MLDVARAARTLLPAAIGRRLVVAGHSEGGHAALWAGQLAHSYAPELELRGVVASAPGANLQAIFSLRASAAQTALNVLRLAGDWQLVYGLPPREILTPAGARDAARLVSDLPVSATSGAVFLTHPNHDAPWMRLLAQNTPGSERTAAPILLLLGTADRDVPVATNLELATRLRQIGDSVEVELFPGADHAQTLIEGTRSILRFIAQVLRPQRGPRVLRP
jgi:acetyl esterase/lipase